MLDSANDSIVALKAAAASHSAGAAEQLARLAAAEDLAGKREAAAKQAHALR